ncbi:MAG TPA: hypothetical protein VGQ95_00030 [Chthoniobacterales bacterium]|nr:hypothetical protein [Chthoniobacterales bacterium]
MPAVNFTECAGDQWRDDDAAVNEQIINLKSVGAPVVGGGVKRAYLAGEVALETTDTGKETGQREQEGHIERH